MNQISKTKRYKCKQCREVYTKERVSQVVCSTDCAVLLSQSQGVKIAKKAAIVDKRETKEKLDKLAKKSDLTKPAQQAFNAYIRARDYGKRCISCNSAIAWGTSTTGGVCDAGHYISVGSRPNLRFNEDNVHAQCKKCNSYGAGNAANYRIGLIKRMGAGRVESLENDDKPRKYTHEELRELTKKYRQKLKELENDT